jgi:hypothetical protein
VIHVAACSVGDFFKDLEPPRGVGSRVGAEAFEWEFVQDVVAFVFHHRQGVGIVWVELCSVL